MWASPIGMMKSRHSRRALPIQHSQIAFALGALRGVFSTVSANPLKAASNFPEIDTIPIVGRVKVGHQNALEIFQHGPQGDPVPGELLISGGRGPRNILTLLA